MGGGLAGGQAEELVAAVDIDGDGKISMAELSLVMVKKTDAPCPSRSLRDACLVHFGMPIFSFISGAPLKELSLVTVQTDIDARLVHFGMPISKGTRNWAPLKELPLVTVQTDIRARIRYRSMCIERPTQHRSMYMMRRAARVETNMHPEITQSGGGMGREGGRDGKTDGLDGWIRWIDGEAGRERQR